jgi:hypothetical protein
LALEPATLRLLDPVEAELLALRLHRPHSAGPAAVLDALLRHCKALHAGRRKSAASSAALERLGLEVRTAATAAALKGRAASSATVTWTTATVGPTAAMRRLRLSATAVGSAAAMFAGLR